MRAAEQIRHARDLLARPDNTVSKTLSRSTRPSSGATVARCSRRHMAERVVADLGLSTRQMRLEMRLNEDTPEPIVRASGAFYQVTLAKDAGFEPARACTQHAFRECLAASPTTTGTPSRASETDQGRP